MECPSSEIVQKNVGLVSPSSYFYIHKKKLKSLYFSYRGFVEEGIKRKQLWMEGEWIDEVVLGILDDEWKEWKVKRQASLERSVEETK